MTWRLPEEEETLLLLKGTPIAKRTDGERGKWNRFLDWLLPWLSDKRDLGEALLRAKVRQEEAIAAEKLASARKTEAETAEIYSRIEIERAKALDGSKGDLEQKISELEDKLEALKLRYGGSIRILHHPPPDGADDEGK